MRISHFRYYFLTFYNPLWTFFTLIKKTQLSNLDFKFYKFVQFFDSTTRHNLKFKHFSKRKRILYPAFRLVHYSWKFVGLVTQLITKLSFQAFTWRSMQLPEVMELILSLLCCLNKWSSRLFNFPVNI